MQNPSVKTLHNPATGFGVWRLEQGGAPSRSPPQPPMGPCSPPTPLAVIPWWLLSVALTLSHLHFDPWVNPAGVKPGWAVVALLGSPRPGAVAEPRVQSLSLSGWGPSSQRCCCFWASVVPSVKGERKRRKMVTVPRSPVDRPLIQLLQSPHPH